MTGERRLELWSMVSGLAAGSPVAIEHLGIAVLAATCADAVAVAVTVAAAPREAIYVSDRMAEAMEDLALTFGEGPGAEALTGGPSLAADLTTVDSRVRWPSYAPAAVAEGVHAAFAFPLRIGAIRLGVMDVYRATPGALAVSALADALILADLTCAILLDTVHAGRNGLPPLIAPLHHPEIHQATGMVAVQLGASAAVALLRLRAHAYAAGRELREVSGDVVARRLRFSSDSGSGEAGPR